MRSRFGSGARAAPVLMLMLATACDAVSPLSPHRHSPTDALRAATPDSSIGLSASTVSTTRIDLSWNDNANGESGWEIHRATGGTSGTFTLLKTTLAGVTTYSDQDLQVSTEYCYKVRSYKTAGRKTTYGDFSSSSCATTFGPPRAPGDVRAVPAGFGQVDVRWTLSGMFETSIRVERSDALTGPWEIVSAPGYVTTSFLDSGRGIEALVCYRVIAINAFGESPASTPVCTIPPRAPTNLSAHSADAHSIDISWKDNSNVEDGYAVERAPDGANIVFAEIAAVGANVTTVHDANVVSDTRYWYRVRARKDGGYSEYSAWLSAAAASVPPTTPSNVNALPNGSTRVDVTWTATSITAESFRIERSTSGGAWLTAATTDGGTTWLQDPGLTSEQLVCYRVVAVNRVGESAPSATDCTAPPAAPSSLEVVSINDQELEIRWKDNSMVEDGYQLSLITYCDPYGCYLEPTEISIQVPANTQSWIISASDSFLGIQALKDDGQSDFVPWPPAALRRAPPTANKHKRP